VVALVAIVVDADVVVAVEGLGADADQQLDDLRRVRGCGVARQLEQERHGCRGAPGHVALVVNGAVKAAQGLFSLRCVVGGQRLQQVRHVLGRAVRVVHRRPVDVIESFEHGWHYA
jgi:hypothetical protein